MSKITLIALIITTLTSCIFEKRDQCPSYITFDLSDTPEEVDRVFLVLKYEDGMEIKDTVDLLDTTSAKHELAIPKGRVYIAAYGNVSRMVYDNGYSAPKGWPIDKLYTHFSQENIDSESCREKIMVKKDYIALFFKIMEKPHRPSGVILELFGNSIGYTNSGRIMKGDFYHSPEPENKPTAEEPFIKFSSIIPRIAKGEDFRLSISTEGASSPLADISLSEKLYEAGIDMTSEEIQDLYLTIDISRASILISAKDFESTPHQKITF